MPGQRRDPGAHGRVRSVGARTLSTAGAVPAGTAPPVCRLVRACTLGASLLRRTEWLTSHGVANVAPCGSVGAGAGSGCGGARCGVSRLVRACTLGAALLRRTEWSTSHGIASAARGANGPAVRRVLSRRLHGGDGHLSRTDVAVGLQRSTRGLGEQPQRPLSDLAPGEVYRADPVTRTPGGLLHHRFTLTDVAAGGLLSVALSRGLLRVGVTHRPALWSPDVPRHSRGSDATVSPTHSQVRVYRPRVPARPHPRPCPFPCPEVPKSRHVGAHEGAPSNLGAPQTASRGTSAPAAGRVEPHRTPPAPHGAGQCRSDRPTVRPPGQALRAARVAAPMMPALLRSVAGMISACRSSSGRNSSYCFDTPPPTTKSSGESRASSVE
ncbi:hypothetical protein EDF48_10336 [Curtobacterium sp. PhB191]|nr:hypothetical protein EDF48_10336 [Curtobacterium sp. PhB191]